MKPRFIALGLISVTVLSAIGYSYKSKLDYEKDGREIVKLIAEYKGWGVPTTNAEYEKLYPEIVINEKEANEMFVELPQSKMGQLKSILLACTPSDTVFLENYLLKTKKIRDEIASGKRVRHWLLIDDELILSFCLAALLDSYRQDSNAMEANLNHAITIINRSIIWPRSTDAFVGVYMSRYVLQTFLRIVEQSPAMTPKIIAMMENRNLLSMINARGMVYEQFLQDIIAARHLDTPLLDKARPPALLRRLIKVPTDEEILESRQEHNDDYVPVSRTGRFLLRERLESWKPVIIKTAKARYSSVQPDLDELEKANSFSHSVPSDLVKLFNQDEHLGNSGGTFRTDTDFRILLQIVTNALKAKANTGKFPDTLAQVAPSVSPSDYRYRTIRDGFAAEIIWHDEKRPSFVHDRISFPLDYSIGPKRIAGYRASIASAQKQLKSSKTP